MRQDARVQAVQVSPVACVQRDTDGPITHDSRDCSHDGRFGVATCPVQEKHSRSSQALHTLAWQEAGSKNVHASLKYRAPERGAPTVGWETWREKVMPKLLPIQSEMKVTTDRTTYQTGLHFVPDFTISRL